MCVGGSSCLQVTSRAPHPANFALLHGGFRKTNKIKAEGLAMMGHGMEETSPQYRLGRSCRAEVDYIEALEGVLKQA